ncbi:GNAT family N-acetyltransferase [Actinotalea fermentans]|uniref:N-acetyltransferase GCN5 n=1 Tax=Actinotalea fermentans TaxID=43671 RepID=A0A511YX44_9CELL|nr:GNAT family protein [Actinotalea fermentans]KGM14809.1 alanine acetyltransferase [Actinotalea fermentans ATCC 43279 = JCM 9966 = DSM 3133]GEN79749.1 N-acetyltransferase GCN5 [Actinotalea fermentans]
MARGWPVELREGDVLLRPLRRSDGPDWLSLRARNEEWLRPWEATAPEPPRGRPPTFAAYARVLARQARAGETLPFAVVHAGELVGQLTVASVTRGSLCSASVGYWVSEHVAGRGIIPTAVALAVDHCLGPVGLHRVEIAIRPENAASLRVVAKLGLREEGVRERYLHIQGGWRDHRTFAVTAEEVPGGLVARWRRTRTTQV